MKTTKEAWHMPDILAELSIPRYLWPFLSCWHTVKNKKTNLNEFWAVQMQYLKEFDDAYLNEHSQPTGPACAQQPQLPPKPMLVMLAKGLDPSM